MHFFKKLFANLETRAAHTYPNHSQILPTPLGGLHPLGQLIKTLRWDDLRDGGDASKIIFLRVLSGHLSTTRYDRLSRFLNHNYEINFLETHNQFAYIIRDLWPVTGDLRIRPIEFHLSTLQKHLGFQINFSKKDFCVYYFVHVHL